MQQAGESVTGVPQNYACVGSRDGWKPSPHTQLNDSPIGVNDGVRRTPEMVVAPTID